MKKTDNGIFPFYTFENLSAYPKLLHFVSSGAMDIGYPDGIASGNMLYARQKLGEVVGFDAKVMTLGHQVHSCHVVCVRQEDCGRGGRDRESRIPDTDALVTNLPGICLTVLSADCVPILLFDPEKEVIAAVHAGWRGTVAGIAAETVRTMQKEYGCRPETIRAGIGPSIGKCCFEVGKDVAERFLEAFRNTSSVVTTAEREEKYYVDLWEANRLFLISAGLSAGNIELALLCTRCHPGEFFSYRYNGNDAGRFGAGIMLPENKMHK